MMVNNFFIIPLIFKKRTTENKHVATILRILNPNISKKILKHNPFKINLFIYSCFQIELNFF